MRNLKTKFSENLKWSNKTQEIVGIVLKNAVLRKTRSKFCNRKERKKNYQRQTAAFQKKKKLKNSLIRIF